MPPCSWQLAPWLHGGAAVLLTGNISNNLVGTALIQATVERSYRCHSFPTCLFSNKTRITDLCSRYWTFGAGAEASIRLYIYVCLQYYMLCWFTTIVRIFLHVGTGNELFWFKTSQQECIGEHPNVYTQGLYEYYTVFHRIDIYVKLEHGSDDWIPAFPYTVYVADIIYILRSMQNPETGQITEIRVNKFEVNSA